VAKDFLRQIVNPTLLEFEIPVQILTEIRKKLEAAENKYNFSAFGGDPKNLAKFFKSPLWKEIVELFEAAGAGAALVKVLEKTKEAYKDDEEIVRAVEEALKELKEKGKENKEISIIEMLKKNVEEVIGDVAEVKVSEDKVVIEGDKVEGRLEEEGGKYTLRVLVRGTYTGTSIEEIKELLSEIKKLINKLSPP